MAEKITDKQVSDLMSILRTDAPIDAKVQQLTTIKSGIKQNNVPESSVPLLFEALRTASASQHAVLVNAGFTALNHLLTRLSRQEPKLLGKEAGRTLPLIMEKLGDQKDKFRMLASQSLMTLWKITPVDVERSVRNIAMVGKNPRAKEASLQWLLQVGDDVTVLLLAAQSITLIAEKKGTSRAWSAVPQLRAHPYGIIRRRRWCSPRHC